MWGECAQIKKSPAIYEDNGALSGDPAGARTQDPLIKRQSNMLIIVNVMSIYWSCWFVSLAYLWQKAFFLQRDVLYISGHI